MHAFLSGIVSRSLTSFWRSAFPLKTQFGNRGSRRLQQQGTVRGIRRCDSPMMKSFVSGCLAYGLAALVLRRRRPVDVECDGGTV